MFTGMLGIDIDIFVYKSKNLIDISLILISMYSDTFLLFLLEDNRCDINFFAGFVLQ